MSKKKVIFMLPLLCPGGAERALITLMNNLDLDVFEPEIIVLKEGGTLKNLINTNIPYHSLGNLLVKNAFLKLKAKLHQLEPDIVVTTMVHSNFLLMLMKPFFPNTKFIIREAVIPSSIFFKHKNKAWFIKLLYKCLYPLADKIISPSQEIIDEFENIIGLNTKNHTVLYNQVDADVIAGSLNELFFPDIEKDMLRFVCVGRLTYQKGYDRLLEALKDFKPPYKWKLIFLGDGEERENLVGKYGLENNIEFLGNVSTPWSIIAAADFLLLPSRWEGMPNVVLEALASGTRVISSPEANGVREIQNNSPKNAVIIAKDMHDFINIMNSTKPQNKTTAGKSILSEPFQTKTITQKFETILLE